MMARLGLYVCLGLVLLALQFTGSVARRRPVAAGRTRVSGSEKKLGVVTPTIERTFLNIAGSDGVVDGFELTDMLEVAADRMYTIKPKFSTAIGHAFVLLGKSAEPEKFQTFHKGLGVKGFALVVDKFNRYKEVYLRYDTDKSLALDKFELRNSLPQLGYYLNKDNRLDEIIEFHGNKVQQVNFEGFMQVAIQLDLLKELYPEGIPLTTEIVRKFILI